MQMKSASDTDDDHRDVGADRLLAQMGDELRSLTLCTRRRQEYKIGAVIRTKGECGIPIGERLGDGSTAERAGQAFEDLQIGDAVIDDDHQR